MVGLSLITNLIESQDTYFTANGRNRKCYFRLIHDPFNHPIFGYETKAYTVANCIYCIYNENEDLREKDIIIYKADEYIINSRVTRANKEILLLWVNPTKRNKK